jgi:hypothetical protein
MKHLNARLSPAFFCGLGQPELEPAHFPFGPHIFIVAGGHPLHLAGIQCAAFIAVKDRAVENESHVFKTCMRVRTTNWPVANVKMIVHQQDEGNCLSRSSRVTRQAQLDAPDRRIQVPLEER